MTLLFEDFHLRTRALIPAPAPRQSLIDEQAISLAAENKSPRTIRGYCDTARFFHLWLANPIAPPDANNPEAWLASVPPAPTCPEDYEPKHVNRVAS
ncbi:hypothetical protein, partial [Amycolatopsis jejuensis]|uniref:hypothetical protein n=1 Tax=Amycolatopsis jejuensis TaxID=330084 RepID=UPI0012E006F9